jgi:hypothetical protein
VLLLATAMTVIMTVVFTSRTETKVTKLQQDADKSLAASEAGIEVAIPNVEINNEIAAGETSVTKTFSDLDPAHSNLGKLTGIDLEKSTVTVDVGRSSKTFVTPQIGNDEQYSVFLAPYSGGDFGASPRYNSGIELYYGDDATPCDSTPITLELTYVYGTKNNYKTERYLGGSQSSVFADNASNNVFIDASPDNGNGHFKNNNYACKVHMKGRFSPPDDAKLLLIGWSLIFK